MALRLRDDSDFKPLLDALADELVMAAIYFKLYQDLIEAKNGEYEREISQSWTFWSLTLRSLIDATVYRICKAYDHNRDSLNLKNLLELVRERQDVFDRDTFRERLKDNPYVDSLAKDTRLPDAAQLEADLEFVQVKSNPLVKRLVTWRDKFYAHRDPAHALDPTTFDPLLVSDVETLVKEGMRIINYYSSLYAATTHSTQMVGHDDYLSVLKAVRKRLERYEAG
ncbi:MAG: hypothetical protein GEV06_21010 [Luteitalea sp.]|nr:hypothetical protein [Luteitalea sp.]